jgi:hypothetical protein
LNGNGKRPETLNCPRCRNELRTAEGAGGLLFRCSGGHGYSARTLLAAQSRQAASLLGDVEAALESHLTLSGELASKAQVDGQRHLLDYLDRMIDAGRETLGFVQSNLREPRGSEE